VTEIERERSRRYAEEHREAKREASRRWRERNRAVWLKRQREAVNPAKLSAHNAVRYAIRKGKMVRPDRCSHCEASCRPHAHHADYDKRLSVVWLCHLCHMRVHAGLLVVEQLEVR
jgi:hypothetical protein